MAPRTVDRSAAGLLPDGIDPPADIPPEIFATALETFLSLRRIDMRGLAAELGMGRATLYRKVGDRDRLLGEVLWFLTRRAIARAVAQSPELTGPERILMLLDRFMADVSSQPGFRRLLDAEPEIALRVLTSKHGPVQHGLVQVVRRMLDQEEARGALRLTIDPDTLAYVIVRIGESFLYADVIAGHPADVGEAVAVVERLLEGSSVALRRGRR